MPLMTKAALRALFPLLLLDATLISIDIALGSKPISWTNPWVLVFEVLSYSIVVVVGYIGWKTSSRYTTAVLLVTIFWFAWRPVIGSIVGLSFAPLLDQDVDSTVVKRGMIGMLFVSVLFYPIALVLGWIGAFIAQRRGTRSS